MPSTKSKAHTATTNRPPPEPRPYRSPPAKTPTTANVPSSPPEPGFLARLWPSTQATTKESKDPARGAEASRRAVKEGILDPRYKDAARKLTRAIVALPIALVLGYVLFQRRFMGVEQKRRDVPGRKEQKVDQAA